MTTTSTETFNKVLKIAVEKGNLELIQLVCAQSTPTNYDECLVLATEKGQTDIIFFLMQKMAPPVSIPIQAGVPVLPRKLVILDEPLDMSPMSPLITENSALMATMVKNPAKALKDLESGVVSLEEINHRNVRHWTVLLYVIRNAKSIRQAEEIVQKLIDLGANVNDNTYVPAIYYALRYSRTESTEKMVEILLKHPKINLNLVAPVSGQTPLIEMISHPREQISFKSLELLLKDPRLNLNAKNIHGKTVLMYISDNGNKFFSPEWFTITEMILSHKDLKDKWVLTTKLMPQEQTLQLLKTFSKWTMLIPL